MDEECGSKVLKLVFLYVWNFWANIWLSVFQNPTELLISLVHKAVVINFANGLDVTKRCECWKPLKSQFKSLPVVRDGG